MISDKYIKNRNFNLSSISKLGFGYEGYQFIGWKTDLCGDNILSDMNDVIFNAEDVWLSAQWGVSQYGPWNSGVWSGEDQYETVTLTWDGEKFTNGADAWLEYTGSYWSYVRDGETPVFDKKTATHLQGEGYYDYLELWWSK